jgi:hypothetical protein
MLPVITAFMAAHHLADVTVVADAGMISDANKRAIEAAGLSFILGMRIPEVPYVVAQWRRDHPGQQIPEGHIFTQPWPAGPADKRRDQIIYYQYRHDRARRTLRGIDQQVTKAERGVRRSPPQHRGPKGLPSPSCAPPAYALGSDVVRCLQAAIVVSFRCSGGNR